MRVRNAIGHSNGLELKVKWNLGGTSWSAGGSTAGSIVSIGPGSGYPESIDFLSFNIVMAVGIVKYPVTIVSCCADNTISLEIPQGSNQNNFVITFTGPINSNSKSYVAYNTYTPTASISSPLSTTVGAQTI